MTPMVPPNDHKQLTSILLKGKHLLKEYIKKTFIYMYCHYIKNVEKQNKYI